MQTVLRAGEPPRDFAEKAPDNDKAERHQNGGRRAYDSWIGLRELSEHREPAFRRYQRTDAFEYKHPAE